MRNIFKNWRTTLVSLGLAATITPGIISNPSKVLTDKDTQAQIAIIVLGLLGKDAAVTGVALPKPKTVE